MRLIAMINQKGGVGKTTTAVNVSAGVARWGSRVLLVDLDPQAHASMHLGIETGPDEPGIYDVLINGVAVADALRHVSDRLAVIPSHVDLVAAESELSRRPDRELILRNALQPLDERFDFIIVDCPPSLGTLTVNALVAVREVVIPLQPHFLALQGLGMLLETVTAVHGLLNPGLRITGIALCMYDKGTRLAQEVDNDVRQFIASASPEDIWHGARVFDTTIRRNIRLAECPSFGQTIFDYAPGSNGAEDYGSLARELLEMTPGVVALLGAAEGQTADAAQGGSSAAPIQVVETSGKGVEPGVVQQAGAEVDAVLGPGSASAADPLAPLATLERRPAATPDSANP
jgi:chromosome partitioning protein